MRRSLWSIAALFIFPLISFAQIQIGTIRGVVLDAAGSALTDARVLLENPLTGDSNLRTIVSPLRRFEDFAFAHGVRSLESLRPTDAF